jgi:hypothetical protein
MLQANAAKPAQRLATKYRFDDEDMDLFFVAALGRGPTGGLDVGQTFHVASQITDGDGESWVRAFASQGELLNVQADDWLARGARRNAGEARLKAFAAYRSSWQFASPYAPDFAANYARHQRAFAKAMDELQLPATFFQVPWESASLPCCLPSRRPCLASRRTSARCRPYAVCWLSVLHQFCSPQK